MCGRKRKEDVDEKVKKRVNLEKISEEPDIAKVKKETRSRRRKTKKTHRRRRRRKQKGGSSINYSYR